MKKKTLAKRVGLYASGLIGGCAYLQMFAVCLNDSYIKQGIHTRSCIVQSGLNQESIDQSSLRRHQINDVIGGFEQFRRGLCPLKPP